MQSKIIYSLDLLNKFLKDNNPSKVCLVTSENLLEKLSWAIEKIKIKDIKIITIPDGEKAKEWTEVENILKKFIKLELDRNSIVLAFGGGTVGDAVGFASSIFLRGIKYIQIPTTLLAQVDSAHGGKTGINFSGYKNQIGSFYPAIAIVIDENFVKTLSKEQIIDGLGEIIKAGLIKDNSILTLLKKEKINSIAKSKNLPRLIEKAIKVKQYYVKKDYKDNRIRQILNAGHTIGHAIEIKYKISHGKAVIIGLLKELEISESLGFTPVAIRKNLHDLLLQLEIYLDSNYIPDCETILHDKKIMGNKIIFPNIRKEGQAEIVDLDLKKFKKVISK